MERQSRGIMLPVLNYSPLAISQAIAARLKARRLQEGWSRETLATRAGISQWTLKHFESSGQIALETLIKVALVLNEADGFAGLFPTRGRTPTTMAELEKLYPPARKRGRTLP
jgi:transcriptional regulator with XRE-family HTH domain